MKMSNCITVKFSECFNRKRNNIAGIDTPGTDKYTFSAQHAFFKIVFHKCVLPSFKQDIYLAKAEAGKIPGGAGC